MIDRPDPLPEALLLQLRGTRADLERRLAQPLATAEREQVKQEIITLFRRVDGALGRGDRGRDRRRQRELQLRDGVRDERAVAESAALSPAAGRGRVRGPGAGLVARHRGEP